MQLGMEEVPCLYADDLTEQQIKAFRIADNKTAEMSAWDFEKLDIELQDIADIDMTDFGFQNTDFNEGALDDLFTDAPEKEKEPKKIQCPHCGEWFEVE